MFKRFRIINNSSYFCLCPQFYVWFVAGSHIRILQINIFNKIIEIPYVWFGIPVKIITK